MIFSSIIISTLSLRSPHDGEREQLTIKFQNKNKLNNNKKNSNRSKKYGKSKQKAKTLKVTTREKNQIKINRKTAKKINQQH